MSRCPSESFDDKYEVKLLENRIKCYEQMEARITELEEQIKFYDMAGGSCECMATGIGVFEQRDNAIKRAEQAEAENKRLRNWLKDTELENEKEVEEYREAMNKQLREAGKMILEAIDIMNDGPDDSDKAMADSRFNTGISLLKKSLQGGEKP